MAAPITPEDLYRFRWIDHVRLSPDGERVAYQVAWADSNSRQNRSRIVVRRLLVNAAKALRDKGQLPANVDDVKLDHVRHHTAVLPKGADWVKETEQQRSADAGLAITVPASLF